jgi:dihydrofolate synthase / folylpolyglutamate synthase
MTYPETIEYLYSQLPVFQHVGKSAYKEGLDNTLALDEYFGHPHTKFQTIHVGGTNGKGSTSHLLSAILQSAGYKVGLYTSPHLLDFRERIRVDGKMIDENYVVEFVEKHRTYFEPIEPSFFELTTLMAFTYFELQKVDFAIIEVGLGGRLDSTNILSPILSVITNISLDHTQFLGNTLEKIAFEKAGIIKQHTRVVIGEAEGEVRKVFEDKARSENAPILFAEDLSLVKSFERKNGKYVFQAENYPNLTGELGGLAQLKNANTVLTAIAELKNLGILIPDNAVYEGFSSVTKLTGLMGRWQVIHQGPSIVCDTGHNVGGIQYVVEQLKNESYQRLHIVFGMVNDKDITSVLAMLPKDAVYYFTKANIARALDEKELEKQAKVYELHGNTFPSIQEAIEKAIKEAVREDFIFIGGSNFVVSEALSALESKGYLIH